MFFLFFGLSLSNQNNISVKTMKNIKTASAAPQVGISEVKCMKKNIIVGTTRIIRPNTVKNFFTV